jgi:hypothetical protein
MRPRAGDASRVAAADDTGHYSVSQFSLVLQMLLLEKQGLPADGARMCSVSKSRKDKAQFAHETSETQTLLVRLPMMLEVVF